MRIRAVRCHLLSAPYATEGDAERVLHLKTGFRAASMITVETDAGVTGIGETYAGTYAPEAVLALVQQFERELIGENPLDVQAVWNRMRLSSGYWGRTGLSQSVIGGIEIALWDLKGKAYGVPVYELLGGKAHDTLPAYASGGNDKPLERLREELLGYVAAGFRAIKIRINNLPLAGIEHKVRFVRSVIGPEIGLAVDAAQGLAKHPWSVKRALEVATLLAPYDLLWIEEPAEVTNYAGFAEIRGRIPIRVAGGETVTSEIEAGAYLDAGALDLFQPDASMIGGIGVMRRVADACAQKFIPIAVHAWCGAPGMMANYHAAFATRNCEIVELPTVHNPLRDELLVEPLSLSDGRLAPPTSPGLGVHLPEELIERYPYRPGSLYRILGAYPRGDVA